MQVGLLALGTRHLESAVAYLGDEHIAFGTENPTPLIK